MNPSEVVKELDTLRSQNAKLIGENEKLWSQCNELQSILKNYRMRFEFMHKKIQKYKMKVRKRSIKSLEENENEHFSFNYEKSANLKRKHDLSIIVEEDINELSHSVNKANTSLSQHKGSPEIFNRERSSEYPNMPLCIKCKSLIYGNISNNSNTPHQANLGVQIKDKGCSIVDLDEIEPCFKTENTASESSDSPSSLQTKLSGRFKSIESKKFLYEQKENLFNGTISTTQPTLEKPWVVIDIVSDDDDDDNDDDDEISHRYCHLGQQQQQQQPQSHINTIPKLNRKSLSSTLNPLKYAKVIRKRSDREQLPGYECDQCRQFYDALEDSSLSRSLFVSKCSRHRQLFDPPPTTPPHFWDVGFSDETQKS